MYPQPFPFGGSQNFGGQSGGMGRSPFKKIYKTCMKNRNQHVQLMLMDGITYTGFIEYVDQQNVYFAIPYVEKQQENRNQEAQYDVRGYQIYRCVFPLHAVAGVNSAY
ncbi:hypothetical protein AWM68_15695 [Fictibacillus phosphorivorans]|uniref:Uncharacterized protein n=1 Tax=Fictibacillus phosphorivorans TaxID=1221500 RepID=A0A165MUP3_9BACL|nr:hypothetical protein [Fictibacillus phosphorivorans]KZE63455.1 hypothetical protein AWM68_15695 [Fictibacillus phosphorivorans]